MNGGSRNLEWRERDVVPKQVLPCFISQGCFVRKRVPDNLDFLVHNFTKFVELRVEFGGTFFFFFQLLHNFTQFSICFHPNMQYVKSVCFADYLIFNTVKQSCRIRYYNVSIAHEAKCASKE